MIIVGEKINTSRKRIAEAVENRDAGYIIEVARAQADAGAGYIDVNAGTFVDREVECLCWLVETIQSELETPLCLDSPNAKALAAAIELHRGEPMINSISLEKERYEAFLPLVTSRPCKVVALCIAETSMPTTVKERILAGTELIRRLNLEGVPLDKIYVDPLVQPVSVDTNMGIAALGAISGITNEFPDVKTICGLSNVSFGLPERRLINRNFLALCVAAGLSAAIIDPCDKQIMSTLLTVEMLIGRDEYCENFIEAYQSGLFST